MVADDTNAAAGWPESAAPSPDRQALLERIAFLEEQIAELRRASMVEKSRLTPRYARKSNLRKFRHALAMAPVVRFVRKVAWRVLGT